MGLVHAHLAGQDVVALVGGATGQIGDPSGRNTERSVMEAERLAGNVAGIEATLSRIFSHAEAVANELGPSCRPAGAQGIRVVNNMEWYRGLPVVEFMSEVGRHFRMQTMLHKESVKARLGSPEGMSLTEFTYQVFQAYDFYHLYSELGCKVQFGGSDQWGNITAGTDLVRRKAGGEAFGVTFPLLTTAAGEKFGKSAGNAVWLCEHLTSPFDLYQFFLRTVRTAEPPRLSTGRPVLLGRPGHRSRSCGNATSRSNSPAAGTSMLADRTIGIWKSCSTP